jgi:NitT/TauT family transport system substrate-binding protein
LIAKYVYPGEVPDKAAALVEASTFYVDPQARLDVADIERQVNWYKSQGLVDLTADPRNFIDLSFAPEPSSAAQ